MITRQHTAKTETDKRGRRTQTNKQTHAKRAENEKTVAARKYIYPPPVLCCRTAERLCRRVVVSRRIGLDDRFVNRSTVAPKSERGEKRRGGRHN